MRKKLLKTLIVVIVGLGIGYHLAFNISDVPDTSGYMIDIKALRDLARSGQGALPTELRSSVISESAMPGKFLMAGQSWDTKPMVFSAFQVAYPDAQPPIIIDTAWDENLKITMDKESPYYRDRWQQLETAMLQSAAIVVTHEHPDHIGGIAKSANFSQLAKKFIMTSEQKASAVLPKEIMSQEQRDQVQAVTFDKTMLLAPGVVLIKAPGHSPGNILIFVTLQNGNEFMFVGDIAWSFQNLEIPRGRPWAASAFLKEDRQSVAYQLRALHKLMNTPNLNLLVAHDKPQLDGLVAKGIVTDGLLVKKR